MSSKGTVATEYFIKSLLEGAVNAARQRQNLDGIRLWHQQHTTSMPKNSSLASKAAAGAADAPVTGGSLKALEQTPSKEYPLSLRLGCDVRRQIALAEGNAAKTYQRMEEAIHRQKANPNPHLTHLASDRTLYNATSMSELSKIPKLPSAPSRADYDAKRSFEVYGGKHSFGPPLGRVPKKARVMVDDFRYCLNDPTFPLKRKSMLASGFML